MVRGERLCSQARPWVFPLTLGFWLNHVPGRTCLNGGVMLEN